MEANTLGKVKSINAIIFTIDDVIREIYATVCKVENYLMSLFKKRHWREIGW